MNTEENRIVMVKCPKCQFPLAGVIGPSERDDNDKPTFDSELVVHTDCYMCKMCTTQPLPK